MVDRVSSKKEAKSQIRIGVTRTREAQKPVCGKNKAKTFGSFSCDLPACQILSFDDPFPGGGGHQPVGVMLHQEGNMLGNAICGNAPKMLISRFCNDFQPVAMCDCHQNSQIHTRVQLKLAVSQPIPNGQQQ